MQQQRPRRLALGVIGLGILVMACSGGDGSTGPVVGSIVINPTTLPLNGVGATGTVIATVLSTRGTALANADVAWSSDNPSVATVAANGLSAVVTAVTRGTASITVRAVSDQSKSATTVVTVLGVSAVLVSPRTATLDRGSTQTITATVTADAGVSNSVTFTSRNTAVVSVNAAGVSTAVASGSAFVVASSVADPTKRDSAQITVSNACSAPTAYALGATVSGAVTIADCEGKQDILQYTTTVATTFYSATLSTVQPVVFSPLGETGLGLTFNAGFTGTLFGLANAGTHLILITAVDTAQRGGYILSSTVSPATSTTCGSIFASFGVTRALGLASTCPAFTPQGLAGTFVAQQILMNVPAGKTLRVTVVGATYAARIEIKDFQATTIRASGFATAAGQPAVATFVANSTNAGGVAIFVTSQTSGATGSYTVTIDP